MTRITELIIACGQGSNPDLRFKRLSLRVQMSPCLLYPSRSQPKTLTSSRQPLDMILYSCPKASKASMLSIFQCVGMSQTKNCLTSTMLIVLSLRYTKLCFLFSSERWYSCCTLAKVFSHNSSIFCVKNGSRKCSPLRWS